MGDGGSRSRCPAHYSSSASLRWNGMHAMIDKLQKSVSDVQSSRIETPDEATVQAIRV
jgi:hypothetical protein